MTTRTRTPFPLSSSQQRTAAPGGEASGLIDIRTLGAMIGGETSATAPSRAAPASVPIVLLLFLSFLALVGFFGGSVYYFLNKYSYNDLYKRLETRARIAAEHHMALIPYKRSGCCVPKRRTWRSYPKNKSSYWNPPLARN